MNLSFVYKEVLKKHNKPYAFESKMSSFLNYILSFIQGFNYQKYFKRRSLVIDPNYKNFILKTYYFCYVKKIEANNMCSFGTGYNSGARFLMPPILEHGPCGIIIGHDAVIGRNCTILQQVTIAQGGVRIGDNVFIGAGAKILPGVKIGNNAKIGANAVVIEDVPDNATCVLSKPRIILKDNK